jgi:glycosyltransferase involved in cell wall biosynthesis
MRIKLISGIYPPEIGGPAQFIPKLADFLLKKSHECEVLTLGNKPILPSQQAWTVDYIKRDKLPIRFTKVIAHLLRERKKSDIYFANGLIEEVGIFLFVTRRKGVAKIVGDAVWERARNNGETVESVSEFNLHDGTFKQRIERILLVFALNQFKLVMCPSHELKNLVSRWGVRTPIVVIQNGVTVPDINQIAEKEFDVVTVSRLVNWKNVDFVIKACHRAGASLTVVGEGPEREQLEAIAKENDLKVFFAGNIDNFEIPNILKKSKLFVLYSDYEGLSFALLEAMSYGVVPVVSNCEGNTSVITNGVTGYVVPMKNLEYLAQSIKTLLSEEKLRESMAVNSKALIIDRYNLEDRLNDYLNFFGKVA